MRSQSRELSEKPEIRSAKATSPKKHVGRKPIAADLEPVQEQVFSEEQLPVDNLTPIDEGVTDAADEDTRRESAHSGISGTTAKTSFSQEEIAELDADVMVDVLPNMADAAEQLIKLLMPAEAVQRPIVLKEIRIDGSRHNKLFKNRLGMINLHKHHFGSQAYIQPSIVLRAFLAVPSISEVPAGPWRPDNILYKINLAEMLRMVLVDVTDPFEDINEAHKVLGLLETYFLTAIAGPAYDREDAHACLAIQTQLALTRLRASANTPSFNPHDIITDTFLVRNANGDLVYKYADVLKLDQDANSLHQRINSLQSVWDSNAGDIVASLRALKVNYPWEQFTKQMVDYFEHRMSYLDREIQAVGGIRAILSHLADAVEVRKAAVAADVHRQSLINLSTTPKKEQMKNLIAQMKAVEKRLSANAAPPQTPHVATVVDPQLTQNQQLPADDSADEERTAAQDGDKSSTTAQQPAHSIVASLSGFQNLQRQQARKGKQKASFVDPQPNATRVSFEDTQPVQQQEEPVNAEQEMPGRAPAPGPYHGYAINAAKRKFTAMNDEPEDFDPTQDEGFQTDQRDGTVAEERRRRLQQLQEGGKQPGRLEIVDYDLPGSIDMGMSSWSTGSSPKRPRKNPGAIVPDMIRMSPNEPALPENAAYEQAKALAKQDRIVSSQRKPLQVRTPWTQEEDNRLINLIVENGDEGISYAALKRLDQNSDNILSRRSAEDMRFKARNMKLTFLRSRGAVPLPENFDKIALDRKAIEQLRGLGIPYEQDPIRSVGRGDTE